MNQFNTVCFIGLGYVGLPTAIIAATYGGYNVIGVDIDPAKVEMTNNGHLHFAESGLKPLLHKALNCGSIKATLIPEKSDAYFIVVPTPVDSKNRPDLSMVYEAINNIIPLLEKGCLIVIESTCPMGTTESAANMIYSRRPDLEGEIYIAYCPERVLPGNVIYELINNDRVIGGINQKSAEKVIAFYSRFVKGKLYATNTRTAELCKLTENSFRDVQIAFANELSIICDMAGVNVWELINLANKHPRVNILRPGCGVGGHCIAVDPYFIISEFQDNATLISKGREVNKSKADWIVEQVSKSITEYVIKTGNNPVIALMGLAYKADIGDLRESSSLYIARNLKNRFSSLDFRFVEPNIIQYHEFKLTYYQNAYDECDIAVFLTPHHQFYSLPYTQEKVILDYCGIFMDVK